MLETSLQELKQTIVRGNQKDAVAVTTQLIEAGAKPQQILNEGLIAGMSEVGERFKCGEYFVPEMLIAARAMKSALEVLRPHLVDTGVKPIGTIVLGTVRGDLHDIGKNLTGMFLEGAGFQVVDLGVDVTADKFIAAVKEHKADLLGMSALLTTTMTYTAEVIRALKAANLRDQVKVIIGGAPITEAWANQIGADGFALDAASGAERCKELLQ
ncbi:MAG TPA: corrinoid protein [Caldilineaceae bacterium]|nr:corrinoid protein [Caldilineaceae bacterium]